ncbi:MAG TPA: FHA domain-containing protein [Ktedonobacteraceae bacterium]|nr:FHA domain-containing protein [Ktedonobacteraceae bacterium]
MAIALLGPEGRVNLSMQIYTFGSAPDNQFVLTDFKVSPRHAALQLQGRSYALVDLRSINGTYLNEQQIAPDQPVVLQNGDRIRIGYTLYAYEMSQSEAPAFVQGTAQSSSPSHPPILQASGSEYEQSSSSSYPPAMQESPAGYSQGPYFPPMPGYGQPGQASLPYTNPAHVQPADPNFRSYLADTPQPGLPYASFAENAPKKRRPAALVIVLILVLLLGGSVTGLFVYLSRPQPVITLTSNYKVGATSIGASSTSFEVVGHRFSGTSTITFLLDGSAAPGSPAAYSDSNGNLTTVLKVANKWPLGDHILKARDASGYITAKGIGIKVVAPGQSHTPGPDGAPSDDASGTIEATITTSTGASTITLNVTGGSDGGKVCRAEADGRPHTSSGTAQGVAYTETVTASCNGTYKSGKLSYVETVTSHQLVFENGLSCTVQVPYVNAHMDGQFTSATAINGMYTGDPITLTCNMGVGTTTTDPDQGTWTGIGSLH